MTPPAPAFRGNKAALPSKPRMALQVKNVARLDETAKQAIRERATAILRGEVGAAHDR
jgi:(6-4)DNA photolyase